MQSVRATFQELIKDSLIYSLAPLTRGLPGVLLVPVLARLFTPAEYGVLDTVLAFTSAAAGFLVLGMDSATGRFYFDTEEQTHRRTVVSTGLIFLSVVGLVAFVLLGSASEQICILILGSADFKNLVLVALLALPFQPMMRYLGQVLRLERERVKYVLMQLCPTVFKVALSIFLAVKYGIIGAIVGVVGGVILSLILGALFTRGSFGLAFSFGQLKALLRYGIPFGLVGISLPLIALVDRSLLASFRSLTEVGLYGAGLKIGAIFSLCMGGFRQAWGPLVFSRWTQDDFALFFSKMVTYYLFIACVLTLVLTAFSREIVGVLLSSQYFESYLLVPFFCVGWMTFDLYKLFGIGIFFRKKSYLFAVAQFVGMIVALLLDLLLIPRAGILGAAVANTVARISIMLIVYVLSEKLLKISYEWGKILRIGLVTTVALVILSLSESVEIRGLIFAVMTVCLVFVVFKNPYVMLSELKAIVK